jgi:hypothetical protein
MSSPKPPQGLVNMILLGNKLFLALNDLCREEGNPCYLAYINIMENEKICLAEDCPSDSAIERHG